MLAASILCIGLYICEPRWTDSTFDSALKDLDLQQKQIHLKKLIKVS